MLLYPQPLIVLYVNNLFLYNFITVNEKVTQTFSGGITPKTAGIQITFQN